MKPLRSLLLLSLTILLGLPASADSVLYNFTFDVREGSGPAPTGSFRYDAALAGVYSSGHDQAFSNFIVNWNSATFDLTAGANAYAPAVPASTCASGESAAGFFQALVHPENCAPFGLTAWMVYVYPSDTNATFNLRMYGNSDGFTRSESALSAFHTEEAIVTRGQWTVSAAPVSPTPEPGAYALMGTVGASLFLLARRRRARANKAA